MLIDSKNAREMQARGIESRKRNQAQRAVSETIAPSNHGDLTQAPATFAITRARMIERLIDRILKQLAQTEDAREQQAKAMALDRLYGTWADLTGFERRGVSRGKKRKAGIDSPAMVDQPE